MEKLGGEGSFQYNSLADPPRDHPNRRGSLTVIPPPGHPSAWPKVADEEWPVAHRWVVVHPMDKVPYACPHVSGTAICQHVHCHRPEESTP